MTSLNKRESPLADEVVLGVDIGGTNLRTGLVDTSFNLHDFAKVSSKKLLHDKNSVERLVEFFVDYLGSCSATPLAISVGFPSTVDQNRRSVVSTSNIPGLDDVPFAQKLEDATGIRTYVNRDTNFHLLHDIAALEMEGLPTVVGVYPGTGLGSALWINGRLHVGKTGAEGELGHLPIPGNNRVCGCGNIGCVETLAGGAYLEEIVNMRLPGTKIRKVFEDHPGNPYLEEYVENLSVPISAAINLLDPDAVILGGGVSAMPGFPFDLLMEKIYAHARKPLPANNLRVERAVPKQENAVIGAGIYAFGEERKT